MPKIGWLKGRVGPRALTSKVEVPEEIWACNSRVKSVPYKIWMFNKFCVNRTWNGRSTIPHHSSKWRLPEEYWNCLKIYYRGDIVSALHHAWTLWFKWATMWHMRVSQWDWAFRDECLERLTLKWGFQGQYCDTSVLVLRPSPCIGG